MIPHALNGLSFVERLYCHASSVHTNELAKKVKEKPSRGFFVFQTDVLQKGDHAADKMLKDTRGGLWASFSLAINEKEMICECRQALALAVCMSLAETTTRQNFTIGWPDEIVCNDKLTGILRPEYHPQYRDVAVLGLDLYLNIFPDQIKSGFESVITTILAETGVCQSTGTLLRMIAESFRENRAIPRSVLSERINSCLYKKGKMVRAGSLQGILDHVDEKGAACLLVDGRNVSINDGRLCYL